MTRILLVEDHESVRGLAAGHLQDRGFTVDQATDLSSARAAMAAAAYDALVVDLGLPDGDGLELLRGRGPDAEPPAVIVTARDGVSDRIQGLNAGADDYLVKPFDLQELEARLRAVLRRPGRRRHVILRLGALEFDTASREATVAGAPLQLRRREALLLETLMGGAGRIVVRDLLEERLYGFDEAFTPNALEAVVSRLRRALDDSGSGLSIEARRGIGYVLAERAP